MNIQKALILIVAISTSSEILSSQLNHQPSLNSHVINNSHHTMSFNGFDWSPKGAKFATYADDEKIRIWDAKTCKELLVLDHYDNSPEGCDGAFVDTVAWSPDGSKIASAGYDNGICIWDAYTGKKLHRIVMGQGPIKCITWSPNDTYIACLNEGSSKIHIYDTITAYKKYVIDIDEKYKYLQSISWSSDSSCLAAIDNAKTKIIIWNMQN